MTPPCSVRMRSPVCVALTLAVTLFAAPQIAAQTDAEQARTAPLDAPLPMSAEVTVGELDNGLRYFIRENSEPENRAYLRLVVNAGSLLEEDDELGAAHFLEHMAFNGTEHFEKSELVKRLEAIGMRLGAGLNARTSFDETVYMLTVPTDVPEHLQTALQILEDWAAGLTLDPAEIDRERGVVLEEWRGGQGAGSRIRDKHLPVLFEGSRYAERLPIGTPASIESMDRDTLLAFYRKWYRPELMAVVAVGDFDTMRVEGLIREHFARLEKSGDDAPARADYDVPVREGTRYSVAADPEQTAASVELNHLLMPDDDATVGGVRRRLVEQAYNNLLTLRLQEIGREPNAPFVSASSETARPIRATGVYALRALVLENNVDRGLSSLVTESARVARFGFTATELERAKANVLRAVEARYARRESRPSALFAEAYAEAFLRDWPVPSIDYERALYERFVPEITLAEVNAVGRQWLEGGRRVVLVTAPEKAGLTLPDDAALAATIRAAEQASLEAYVDKGAGARLLDELPAGSPVIAERKREGGITEWDLANGVRVVLKPTDFNKDEVLFRGFLAGGGSLAEDSELIAAQTASPVIMASGLADLDVTALQKTLTGKAAAVTVGIQEYDVGLAGQASVKDLQTLFELIYLRFTAPRGDPNAFSAVQNQLRAGLANRDSNPAVALNDAFTRLMTQDHPRARPLTIASLAEMSLERSLAFYRDRFANASGATFMFVGAFDLPAIRPLVELYIGGLPASGTPQTWRDRGMRVPKGVHTETVRKGAESRSQTRIAFHGPLDIQEPRERVLFTAASALLQNQLRDALREELGGTYGVGVRADMRWVPVELGAVIIDFGSDPGRADELAARIFAEIETLKRDGPSAQRVADVRAGILRAHETNVRQNGWWLAALGESYRYEPNPGPDTLLGFPAMVEALTPEMFRDGMRRYLDMESYVRVTLLPEQPREGAAPPAPVAP